MPKLTKRFVDALRPVARDTLYRDADLKGFALRHKPPSANHPQGARTWCVQYKTKTGRTRKLALGAVNEITPEQARTKAGKALASVKAGGDPSAERHTQRADMPVWNLVEAYLTEGPADKPAKKHLAGRSTPATCVAMPCPCWAARRQAHSRRPTFSVFNAT